MISLWMKWRTWIMPITPPLIINLLSSVTSWLQINSPGSTFDSRLAQLQDARGDNLTRIASGQSVDEVKITFTEDTGDGVTAFVSGLDVHFYNCSGRYGESPDLVWHRLKKIFFQVYVIPNLLEWQQPRRLGTFSCVVLMYTSITAVADMVRYVQIFLQLGILHPSKDQHD